MKVDPQILQEHIDIYDVGGIELDEQTLDNAERIWRDLFSSEEECTFYGPRWAAAIGMPVTQRNDLDRPMPGVFMCKF